MACILHSIGASVTFQRGVNWINESTGAQESVVKGETATIKSIDRQNHKLTVEIKSTGKRIIVDASVFGSSGSHSHE